MELYKNNRKPFNAEYRLLCNGLFQEYDIMMNISKKINISFHLYVLKYNIVLWIPTMLN